MNQEQLNAIKERVAKTTPGPWKVVKSEETGVQIGTTWESGQLKNCVPVVTTAHGVEGVTIYINDNNSDFIAHAREDVPALVAEVERLSEELNQSNVERMKLVVDKAYEKSQKHEYIKTIHLVNEENRRLREALEFYADPVTYEPVPAYINGEKTECYPIDGDEGKIARQVLTGESNED